MALGIPLPGDNGKAFTEGLSTGSDMIHKMMLNKYYSGLHPSGDVANAMYVEQLKAQYGENDPRYLQAKAAHEMALAGHQSLMDYRTQLSNLAPYRAATPEEKLIAAQKGKGVLNIFGGASNAPSQVGGQNTQKIQAGMVSGEDGHVISEEEAQVYNKALGKKTTDAAIRNKIPYAQNVKITMDNIIPEDLVQYSGPQGQVKLFVDTVKAAFNNPSEEFMAYQTALTGAKTLSKQLRQFWGDSIQPAATDKIDQLTNPSHWNKNPQVALQQYNQLKQITEQELKTFQNAGTSPLKLDYDKKTDSFLVTNSEKKAKKENGKINVEEQQLFQKYLPELMKINPKYTEKNIRHTATTRKMKVGKVIDMLMAGEG